jgi:lipid II:glycine glycyltransferase (peptidoglycan interpeptide bridge formation enzyme)
LEAVCAFYRLHCMTRKRHGLPPQPFRFFENIYRSILARDLGFIVTASLGRKPIAAALFLHLGKRVIYKFAASDQAVQRLRGSNLVIWQAIKWCVRNGFEELSFGRTSLWNEGLRRFKLGWGADETRTDYFKYDFRTSGFVTEKDLTAAWPTKFFRMMPVRVSKLIGALLYRHIA